MFTLMLSSWVSYVLLRLNVLFVSRLSLLSASFVLERDDAFKISRFHADVITIKSFLSMLGQ
jgi:hypothetical protein